MYSECCLFKFAISLYTSPVLLLPFTGPEIFTFYLMLSFSKLSGAAEVAQYTLQLQFHMLYTYTQSPFFVVLLIGVCKRSSSIHSSLWALSLLSHHQMLFYYIDCANFHHHLWCLTDVIMHSLYIINASEAANFAYGAFLNSMEGWEVRRLQSFSMFWWYGLMWNGGIMCPSFMS